MQFEYLVRLIEDERKENGEFRDEVRDKLAELEQWAAVHDASEKLRTTQQQERAKHISWLVGTIVAIVGIVLPILLKVS